MSYAGPILLMALAGLLLGGSLSLRKAEQHVAALIVAVVALAAFGFGLYLIYG